MFGEILVQEKHEHSVHLIILPIVLLQADG